MFGWSLRETVGKRLGDLGWLPSDHIAALLADTMDEKVSRLGLELVRARHRDGTEIDCEWYGSVLRDWSSRALSLSVQILNVTERRRAEDTQRLLIGELNHRVKNTLASVQAIATQTLRHTHNPEDFSVTFSGRIQSLARAHAMLSDTTWQGAKLADLIRDQLKLGTIDESRIAVSGPEVQLAPQPALRLALIIHELATNANKYGALSNQPGRIELNWRVEGDQLSLQWREVGGPPTKAPLRRGFGTTLIEQSIRADGGTAKASYGAQGVTWNITMTLAGEDRPELSQRFAAAPERASAAVGSNHNNIADRVFLVVEDEPLVAIDLIAVLEDAGARVLGPIGSVEEALEIVGTAAVDAAFLDGNLHGLPVDEVAAALTRRNITFAFVSGYGREHLPKAFAEATVIAKPFSPAQLLESAARLVEAPGELIRLRS